MLQFRVALVIACRTAGSKLSSACCRRCAGCCVTHTCQSRGRQDLSALGMRAPAGDDPSAEPQSTAGSLCCGGEGSGRPLSDAVRGRDGGSQGSAGSGGALAQERCMLGSWPPPCNPCQCQSKALMSQVRGLTVTKTLARRSGVPVRGLMRHRSLALSHRPQSQRKVLGAVDPLYAGVIQEGQHRLTA